MGIPTFDKPLPVVINKKDTLFIAKKAARTTAYLVIKNNPQYAVAAGLVIAPIYDAIKSGSTAEAVKTLINAGLAKAASKVTKDPLLQAEIADLGELIDFEPSGDNAVDLGKYGEILDAFMQGIKMATA